MSKKNSRKPQKSVPAKPTVPPAPTSPPAATATPPVAAQSKSTIQSPVKVVWAVCEEMKSAARKDVVAECMRRGVNVHTAKTQYQRFLKATKSPPAAQSE